MPSKPSHTIQEVYTTIAELLQPRMARKPILSVIAMTLITASLLSISSCSKEETCDDERDFRASLIYNATARDCYTVVVPCGYVTLFTVYDRWGNLLYKYEGTAEGTFCWTGTDNDGLPLDVGIYTYILHADLLGDQNDMLAGNVTVLL